MKFYFVVNYAMGIGLFRFTQEINYVGKGDRYTGDKWHWNYAYKK